MADTASTYGPYTEGMTDSGAAVSPATTLPAPEAPRTPAPGELAAVASTAPATAPQLAAARTDMALENLPGTNVPKESFGAKVYHGVLNALGGSHDVTFERDPNTGKMIAHSTTAQPGEQWKRIISGALTGFAGAAAAGTQGPGGAIRGAGAGIQAGYNQAQKQYQQKRAEANEDLEAQQRTAYTNANNALLQHRIAESSFNLGQMQRQADQQDTALLNAYEQVKQEGGPGSQDIGVFKTPNDAYKFAANYRQVHTELANGRVFLAPDISAADGTKGGIRAMIVTPDMLHSPLTRDLIMPIQQPGPDPKTGKGDTHYENMTITAGTPTATALQLISAAFAQKNERDLKEEQLKIQKETAGSEAGLRTAQSASAYAEAAERRSQVLLNDAKAAATASGGEVDWGPGGDKGFNSWHDKNVTPALMKETNYRLSSNLYNEYQALRKQGKDFPAGSQSVQMLANHLQGTFGNVKGARIGKDLIEQHLGARSVSDSALVAVQKLTSGDKLSPAQWDAFFSMIGQTRDESWRSVLDDAQALGRPLDYIAFPSDLRQRWGLGPGRMGQPLGGAAAPAAAPAGGVAVTAPDGKIYQFADQQSADSFKQKAGIK